MIKLLQYPWVRCVSNRNNLLVNFVFIFTFHYDHPNVCWIKKDDKLWEKLCEKKLWIKPKEWQLSKCPTWRGFIDEAYIEDVFVNESEVCWLRLK